MSLEKEVKAEPYSERVLRETQVIGQANHPRWGFFYMMLDATLTEKRTETKEGVIKSYFYNLYFSYNEIRNKIPVRRRIRLKKKKLMNDKEVSYEQAFEQELEGRGADCYIDLTQRGTVERIHFTD
jgi:hypothetical protein